MGPYYAVRTAVLLGTTAKLYIWYRLPTGSTAVVEATAAHDE